MPNNSDRVLAYLAAHPEGQNDDQIGEALHIDRIQINAICRRLAEAGVRYGLALPTHRRFGGLVGRLPQWIRQRLGLWFFFVRPSELGLEVGVLPPNGSYSSLSGVASGDAHGSE